MGQDQGVIIGGTEAVTKFQILLDIPLPHPHREELLKPQLQCPRARCVEGGREGSMGELYSCGMS